MEEKKKKDMTDLTICSVTYKRANKELLELNYLLTKRLNPSQELMWVVADNSPEEILEQIDKSKFLAIPGLKDQPKAPRPWAIPAYHLSTAINKSLPFVKTRFLLVLDCDFYIVRNDWIKDVLDHMQKKDLSFFGTPWHPKYIKKTRYFPAHHALFIDLKKINKDALDFTPDIEHFLKPKTFIVRILNKVAKLILKDRYMIEISREVGFKIYQKFGNEIKSKWECPQPVFKKNPSLLDLILPDKWSFVPKKPGYYSSAGFSDLGYFDIAGEGWEEFIWHDKPFGIHLRGGTGKFKDDLEDKLVMLRECLNSFS